jgi:6-phosphogluconolactonase
LDERKRWSAEVYVAEENLYRVTLTAPLINQAALVAFLVAGATKARVLKEVLEGPWNPNRLPAQLIRPKNSNLYWLVDKKASSLLNHKV